MDEHYLLSTVRYVELNPVHANMVNQPKDYVWSSARAHLAGRDDKLVKVSPMLDRVANWQAYLESDLDDVTIDALRMHTKTGRPLGDDAFVDMLELKLDKILRPLKQGRKRFVIVELNEEKVKRLIEHGASIIQGSALEASVLKKAGVERAKAIIVSLGNDANNIYLTMTASELNPNILSAAEASEETAVKRLHKIGAQIVVLPQVVGGRQLANAVLEVDEAKGLCTISKQ